MSNRTLPPTAENRTKADRVKTAIGYGSLAVACLLIGAAAGATPAQAMYLQPNRTISVTVTWVGSYCLDVEQAVVGGGSEVQLECGFMQRVYPAVLGDLVGARPIASESTTSMGCSVRSNGHLIASEFGHEANCLGYLH